MTEKELGRTKDKELDWLGLDAQDYSNDEDCTDWKFRFYAINKKSYKFVFGFDDEYECEKYCSENGFRKKTLAQALAGTKKPYKLANWTDDYSRKGLI